TPALQQVLWVRGELLRLTDFVRSLPGIELPYQWNPLHPAHQHVVEFAITALEDARTLCAVLRSGRPDQKPASALVDEVFHATRSTAPDQITAGAAVYELGAAWSAFLAALATTPDDLAYWYDGRDRGTAMAQHLGDWQADATGNAFVRLQRWVTARAALQRLTDLGLEDIAGRVRDGSLSGPDVENAVRLGAARAILAERLETTGLEAFDETERARL